MARQLALHIQRLDQDPATIPLEEGENLIGRKKHCDIPIRDRSISSRHALLHYHPDGRVTVEDLDSRNGTRVNGARVRRSRVVRVGDALQFGRVQCALKEVSSAPTKSPRAATEAPVREAREKKGPAPSPAKARPRPVAPAAKKGRSADSGELDEPPPRSRGDQGGLPPARVVVYEEGRKPRSIQLRTPSLLIGSKEENDIKLTGIGVSRYHAELFVQGGRWCLKDLGSRNGTYLGEDKLGGVHRLSSGEHFFVGTVRLELWDLPASGEAGTEADSPLKLILANPVRMAIAVCTLLLVGMFVWMALAPRPTTRAEGAHTSDAAAFSRLLEQGMEGLQAGRFEDAEQAFDDAEAEDPENQLALFLKEIADRWPDKRDNIFIFEWDKNMRLLERLSRLAEDRLRAGDALATEEVLERIRSWAVAEQAAATPEADAHSWSKAAMEWHRKALTLREEGAYSEANEALRAAAGQYQRILDQEASRFAEHALQQMQSVRFALRETLELEADAGLDPLLWRFDGSGGQMWIDVRPGVELDALRLNWDRIIGLYREARNMDFPNQAQAKEELVAQWARQTEVLNWKTWLVQENLKAKQAFERAMVLLQEEKRAEARPVLETIKPVTLWFDDAGALLVWLDNYQLYQQGREQFLAGNGEEALRTLKRILAQVQDTRNQRRVETRMRKIEQVLEAFKQARDAYTDRSWEEALAQAQFILDQTEEAPNHYYRKEAESILEGCRRELAARLEFDHRRALECLEGEQFQQALGYFRTLRANGPESEYYQQALDRLREPDRVERLWKHAYFDIALRGDRVAERPRAIAILRLLSEFLPADHETQRRASDALPRLIKQMEEDGQEVPE